MSYTCRLYINSGFNSINIPDSPALLDTVSHIDVPALQILQSRDLRYVDVKVTSYENIKNADYCRVDSWYYFIDGIQMLNVDTARITLYADYLTSAGGVAGLHILDGITTRVHVASDNYGEWTEEDSFLAPARPLELETVRIGGSTLYTTVVKSTLDLEAMDDPQRSHEGVTYTDMTSGDKVTVPKTIVISNGTETEYELHQDSPSSNIQLAGESNTRLFDADNLGIRKSIQEANDLGINGSITAQVTIPFNYVTPTRSGNGSISKMVGCNTLQALTQLPYEYATVKNKRVLYGSQTPYGILSTGGAKCEFAPHQIIEAGEVAPHLRIVSDPRTDGKPYFRFKTLHGDDSLPGFFNSAVEGIPWKQVPLVYEGSQGSAIEQMKHNQTISNLAFQKDYTLTDLEASRIESIWQAAGQGIGGSISSGVQNALIGNLAGGLLGIGTAAGASILQMNAVDDAYKRRETMAISKYEHDRDQELQSYAVKTTVYSPVVQFPFSADLYRDLYNNGCLVYRYKYSQFDLNRIDKMLTMYGYRVTKPLEASDFVNRTKFNYVEAGVSIGSLPRWWADGIATQLRAGTRVWHVLPNKTHYTNNPIAT